ncbi:chromate transporter [Chryseomicrobium aureum]|uniref:chromate transporter n=1 Tax=Chryseomicrobium aureum TaxID=1441723 RepID=UPI001957F710|nr:chromate transporter [Chryseomicrobium aureum]MBM7706461.1 chromate transporter [Chryseomicrobium aureum]
MIYWELFLAFLIPGILGYGGGPAAIPLVQVEVVDRYGWMTNPEFSEMVAAANALPGPIATKMAGFVGYDQAGVLGAMVALFASVGPSLLMMIVLLNILWRYKNSPYVKNLTKWVRPVIAVLLVVLTFQFFFDSYEINGAWITVFLVIGAYILLERVKLHPAVVILLALGFGAVTTYI